VGPSIVVLSVAALRLEELLALPKVIEAWLSGLIGPVLPPLDSYHMAQSFLHF
jgi:hypothetical protein